MQPICTPHELATLLQGMEVLRDRVNELEALVKRVREVLREGEWEYAYEVVDAIEAMLPKDL